ncbi:MAG TPA: tetratricopeptide repeat protein, partial [Gallionella sp.]|nr:tetratricopeptide repeat protein [Gallionella sp.]
MTEHNKILRDWRSVRALGLLALCLCFSGVSQAAGLVDWRAEIGTVRALAENDAPRAYSEAQRLQAGIPAGALPADKARVLNLLARIETYLALPDRSEQHASIALGIARKNADKEGQAEALLNTVLNAIHQAKLDTLGDASRRSVELLHDVDRPDLVCEAMLRLAMMYRRGGQLDESVAVAVQALEIAKRSNSALALTYAHQGLGISFEMSGRPQEAREHFLQMRDSARAAHSGLLEAHAIQSLSAIQEQLGNSAEAERLARESIAMFRVVGTPFNFNMALFNLADIYRKQNHHEQAVPIFDEVIGNYGKYPNPIGLWYTLNARSMSSQALGRVAAARADAQQAYALAETIGIALYRGESARRMAALADADGDYRRANSFNAEAIEMMDKAARDKSGIRLLELVQHYEADSKQHQLDELKLYSERLWTWLGGSLALLALSFFYQLRLRRSRAEIRSLNFGLEQRVETLLQQRDTEFRRLADNAPDMILRYDRDCRRIYVNPAVERLSGKSSAMLLGKTPTEAPFNPEAECVKVQRNVEHVLKTGLPAEIETQYVAEDGQELHFQNIHIPEFGLTG